MTRPPEPTLHLTGPYTRVEWRLDIWRRLPPYRRAIRAYGKVWAAEFDRESPWLKYAHRGAQHEFMSR